MIILALDIASSVCAAYLTPDGEMLARRSK
jgi:hypothetical protein